MERPSTSSRVAVILMDGARHDVLRELLARGDLPNIARHVLEPGAFTVGTSVFPSTTGVAYIPFLFGCYPGTAGVPGVRWLDREEACGGMAAQWRAARSYCGAQAGWLNRDIHSRPSIFDLVPESLAICTPISRGLAPSNHLIPFRRAVLGSLAHFAGTYPWLDRAVSRALHDAARRNWRFIFAVYPGPDGLTHLTDPFHRTVLDSYRAIDAAVGRFMAIAGQRGDPPAVILTSDHGATTMHTHTDVAVHLESAGVRTLRHPAHVWRRNARAAVMVSGNAAAQIWFAPRSGRLQPFTAEELPSDLLEGLISLSGVRLAAARADDGILVYSGSERAILREERGGVSYRPITGDPLGLGGEVVALEDRETLLRSRATDLPDAPRQLLQLFSTPRAGDVALAAGPGFDFRGPWEIPEHRAGHGSLIAEHIEVPILANVPLPRSSIRTVDLMPAVLEMLGETIPPDLDGLPFTELETDSAVTS